MSTCSPHSNHSTYSSSALLFLLYAMTSEWTNVVYTSTCTPSAWCMMLSSQVTILASYQTENARCMTPKLILNILKTLKYKWRNLAQQPINLFSISRVQHYIHLICIKKLPGFGFLIVWLVPRTFCTFSSRVSNSDFFSTLATSFGFVGDLWTTEYNHINTKQFS